MEGLTQDAMDGNAIHDNNIAPSAFSTPEISSNMADHGLVGGTVPVNHVPGNHALEGSIPGKYDPVGHAHEHGAPNPDAPIPFSLGPAFSLDLILDEPTFDDGTFDLHMGFGDVDGQYATGGSALGAITAPGGPDALSGFQSSYNEVFQGLNPQSGPNPAATAATEMPKFMEFPRELRDMIWDFAIDDSKQASSVHSKPSVQRFRFNLTYDARRVKAGQDKSTGWVACFTPKRINANPHLRFLRASSDSRRIMLKGMSMLTVHELPVDAHGQQMAPRKCHLPFNLAKDDFCVEGITHALEQAKEDKDDKDAVWDPKKLSLDDLLDNALGLRFTPRIKRLVIIPHSVDLHMDWDFINTTNGANMAVLAKRFPALAAVKSAVPHRVFGPLGNPSFTPGSRLIWKTASLRGHRQGGPSRMSQEARDALYVTAWRRIFDERFHYCFGELPASSFDASGCFNG